MKKFLTGLIVTIIVIVVLYLGSIYYFLGQAHVAPQDLKNEWSNKEEHILRMLIVGVDSSRIEENNIRTDSMMVLQMDYESGKVSLLSIPRDSYVYIPPIDRMDKINHAYQHGGIETTKSIVENLLNLEIPYYITIGYDMAREVIDLVGGVEVDVPIDMNYDDPSADPPLSIHLEKGVQILDGDKSIGFLRFREDYVDRDLGRIKAQQAFVKSFLHELKQPTNLLKVPLMVKVYTEHVHTNIPLSKVMKFGSKVNRYQFAEMEAVTLPGVPNARQGISYYDIDATAVEEVVDRLFR